MTIRYDSAPISSYERTPTGGMRVKATISRVGVFPYRLADGSTRFEYRPPSEVLDAASVQSFRGAPVTDLHPDDLVTPENYSSLTKGHTIAVAAQDPFVAALLDVNDAAMIGAIERGDRKEVSCGYTCDLDETPGETPDGERYDVRQVNIRGNHVGLGPADWGRQGPSVALRSDSAVCIVSSTPPPKEGVSTMTTHRIDGIDYEAGSASHIAAVEKAIATNAKRADDAAALAATESKRADDEKKRADAATDPKTVHAAAAARARLLVLAKKHVPKFDADAPETAATGSDKLVSDILANVAPNLDTSGWTPDQMMAAVAAITSMMNGSPDTAEVAPTDATTKQGAAVLPAYDSALRVRDAAPSGQPARRSIEQVRADMKAKGDARWKTGLPGHNVKGN